MTDVLILGASTRAAAHSARRAGLRPICADRFADEDLRATARVLSIVHAPGDFPALAQEAPPCPWMYTGALENHPDVIAEISVDRPLWGNPADVVTAVRDPEQLHAVLSAAGLPALRVRSASSPPDQDGQWMLKPLRGAAGRGVVPWTRRASRSKTLQEPHYFQERSAGTPMSALFLAVGPNTRLIGIARQLVGEKWLGAPPFGYCGSVGPIQVVTESQELIRHMGEVLAERFRLQGLFGIDFLCDGGTPWLTEVNPRYTASVEVLEHAYEVPLLDWHRRAFAPGHRAGAPATRTVTEPERQRRPRSPSRSASDGRFLPSALCSSRMVAKAILYADRSFTVPPINEFAAEVSPHRVPCVVDRPAPGTRIHAGHPICTVLVAGQTEEECAARLSAGVRALRSKLLANSP